MSEMFKRARGRPIGTGKTEDRKTLGEVAKLILSDGTLKPTTVIRRLIGNDNPSAIRRLQEKWKVNKSVYLDEARHLKIDQYDPVHHANAPVGMCVRVNADNADHWKKASLAGFNQCRGLSDGEWIMRRDFRPGFVSPEDMPKFLEQCLKRMGDIPNGLNLRNPLYLTPPEW